MMYKILKIFFKNQDDVWMTNVKEQDRDDDNLLSLHHLDFCNTFFIILVKSYSSIFGCTFYYNLILPCFYGFLTPIINYMNNYDDCIKLYKICGYCREFQKIN